MTREEFRDYVEFLRSQNEISYDVYSELIDRIDSLELGSCEDAISRKEVLEALEQEEPLVWCDGADEITAYDQWSSDVDTIKNMPSVQPKMRTVQ